MSKLYAIHAFEYVFGGLHGIESYEVIEVQNEDEAHDIAAEMSSEVIDEFESTIIEGAGWDREAEINGLEEESEEYWDFIDEQRSDDIAYAIYEIKETNESLETLNEKIQADPEGFLKDYAIN